MKCMTPENIEAYFKGELEFVATSKIATVGAIHMMPGCLCGKCHAGNSKASCNHCGTSQNTTNKFCCKCGQPRQLWSNSREEKNP